MSRRAPSSGRVTAAPVEVLIAERVAAAIAAHAARGVPHVTRLEPGVNGLITHLAARARHQVLPAAPGETAPTEGVDVRVDGSSAEVFIDLSTSPGAQVAAVAHQVQVAVAEALQVNAGLTVTKVSVLVLDIDQAPVVAASSAEDGTHR